MSNFQAGQLRLWLSDCPGVFDWLECVMFPRVVEVTFHLLLIPHRQDSADPVADSLSE